MIAAHMYMLISLKTSPLLRPGFFLIFYYKNWMGFSSKNAAPDTFICLFQNQEGCYHLLFNIHSQSLSQTLSILNNFIYYFAFILMCIIFYLVLNKFYPASTTFSANIMQFSMIFCAFPLAWLTNIQKHTNFFITLGIFFFPACTKIFN